MKSTINSFLRKPLGHWTTINWEQVLYLLLIIAVLATRLVGLGIRVQSHDESLHTKYSWNLYVGQGFQHTPLMHGPYLFHVTALSYFLFGDNDFTARLPVALMGVILVAVVPYILRRWLGRVGALATACFLLISPSIAYYSRYIRHDIPVILWSMLVVFAIFSYLRDGRERWLYLMATGVSLMFATKEVAFIYNAIFGFFLVGLSIYQIAEHNWDDWNDETEDRNLSDVWDMLCRNRSFELVILLGTLCLPFLAPIPIELVGLNPTNYEAPTIYYSGLITILVLLISIGIGLAWDWRRWSIAAAIHYAIFFVLFTTVFTNGTGIASGMIGSLGYWLEQQGVKRGGQPWYYYGIIAPLYEYLPLLLSLITMSYLAIRAAILNAKDKNLALIRDWLFVIFLIWWIVLAWIIYSYAGEKMPWLVTHLALPMILLSGWAVGQFIEQIDWHRILQQRSWLLALLAPPFIMALGAVLHALRLGPFQGYSLEELNVTGQLIGGLIGTITFGLGLLYLIRNRDWRANSQILALLLLLIPFLLTIRHSWRACFINFSYPIEHLVYAHAGPAVRDTMEQIDELSRRIAGGPKLLKVAYGADGSWPFHWYFRNYPNSIFYGENPSRDQLDAPVVIAGRGEWEDVSPYMSDQKYIENTYTFLWWPMEDYKNLSWERLENALTNPQMHRALWDIWYNRDYTRYDEITDKTHTLDEWPLRNEYRLYIRRDVASQIWDLSTAGTTDLEMTGPYENGWQDLAARKVFGSQGTAEGQLQNPRGITVGPQGFVYVADTGNHRIQKFTAEGEFVAAWGQQSSPETEADVARGFNEPWDVTVAPDGSIYVADTWNHRVQKLDADGNPIAAWGRFGQYSPDNQAGSGAFYGPRGLAVGPEGRIYVADTGNKRVQVFEPNGAYAFEWGGAGTAEGYLDEPVGIAIDSDNQVFVADTWNRRVQVFAPDGTFLRQWPIEGWDAGIAEEKPYLAVDAENHVYVTDPGNYRVLVFDDRGAYLTSFGQYGTDERSFALPTGIAVAKDGTIYVTDAHAHRVLIFDPLELEDGE